MDVTTQLQEARYTSPSGKAFTFGFKTLKESVNHKFTEHTFLSTDGAYIQDKGVGARQFPITIYITGENYLRDAINLFKALSEEGAGFLNHPLYGALTVNPVAINRSDDLVGGMGQSVFEIEFVETLTLEFPKISGIGLNKLQVEATQLASGISTHFANSFNVTSLTNKTLSINRFKDVLKKTTNVFSNLSHGLHDFKNQYQTQSMFILSNLDELIGDPLLLASEMQKMFNYPAQLGESISLALASYRTLATQLFGNKPHESNLQDSNLKNKAAEMDMVISSIQTSAMLATLPSETDSTPYKTQDELSVAIHDVDDLVINTTDELNAEIEDITSKSSLEILYVFDPNTMRHKYDLKSEVIGNLEGLIFGLKTRYTTTLNKIYTPVTLLYALYGEITDEALEDLAKYNHFNFIDFLYLAKGREITYYK